MNYREKKYRRFLICSLIGSVITLMVVSYSYCYSRVPSNIKIRAGMEQTIEFGIPVTGEFVKDNNEYDAVTVSEMPGSNVRVKEVSEKELSASIRMTMQDKVTLYASNTDEYKLQLKLLGFIPLKEVEVQVIEDKKLTPAGTPIGIYVKTEGVLVVGVGEFTGADGTGKAPSKYILKTGDYITAVDGRKVEGKAHFMSIVSDSSGKEMILTVKRDEEVLDVKIEPEKNTSGEYKLGIWVRDNAQGIGTLTYVDSEGKFGALGHGINDIDTSDLLALDGGTLYHTEIIGIRKGIDGVPGEMTGMIDYSDNNILGEITTNSQAGIYGFGNDRLVDELQGTSMPIALKQEIKIGPAQILCTVDNYVEAYDVEIIDLKLENDNVNRGIVLEITDPRLLETTGGIIQGMSGAPIIQNGRIVGAVTHVLVNDSAKGYGIFIETMLEH